MRTLVLLALFLVPTLALRRVEVDERKPEKAAKAPKAAKLCQVPANFKRTVNPKAHRMPTQEEMNQKSFYEEPRIEKIYYINLEKSENRRLHIEEQIQKGFPGVKSERWVATGKGKAGKFLKQNLRNFTLIGYGGYSNIGIQATYLSHVTALQKIAEEKDPNAVFMIMEDDVWLHKPNLMENVNCQLKMLPPEWDIFKFGYWGFRMEKPVKHTKWPYPNCAGEQINEWTCHQEHFNWNYMGNQAYAVRPQGARNMLEHLKKTPIMDVDGGMMPGITWNKKVGKPLWPNTYVAKHNMVGHGGFASVRMKSAVAEEGLDEMDGIDESVSERLMKEAKDMANDEDSMETSADELERLERGESDLMKLRPDQFD